MQCAFIYPLILKVPLIPCSLTRCVVFLAGSLSLSLSIFFRTLRKHDVDTDKGQRLTDVKRLRSELGEWMRCGREVLNEANTNELEQFYLKMAK